jgi:GNAT superfamily N-acetyltransferase
MADDTTARVAQLRTRRAALADAEMLARLGARTFRETFGSQNTPENMASYLAKAFDVPVVARELADPNVTYIVGEIEDHPAAYAMVRIVPAPPSVTGPLPLELVRFYVDRPWHGAGMASALMQACDDEAHRRGARTLWLGVWEKNPRAIRFYEKCGFRDVGSQTFMVGDDPQTDRVMSRPIPVT